MTMPRALCPFCGRDISLTGGGRFRYHHNHMTRHRRPCPGSDLEPERATTLARRWRRQYESWKATRQPPGRPIEEVLP